MNSEALGLTFSIEKAPSGGYYMRMGENPSRVDAARSSLPEIMELIHARAAEKYQDPAWYGPQVVYRDRPIVPPMPAQIEDPEMPNVVKDYERNGGLMSQFNPSGALRAMIPFLFVSLVLWSVRLPV